MSLVDDHYLVSQIDTERFSSRFLKKQIVRQRDQLSRCDPLFQKYNVGITSACGIAFREP